MLIALLLGGLCVSVAVSLVLTPVVRGLALRNQWVDVPDARKIHARITPRVGGLAIVLAFLCGIAYFALVARTGLLKLVLPSWHVLVGGIAIAAIGFYDDLRHMNFKTKFAAQILLAGLMILGGYRVDVLSVPFSSIEFDLALWLSVPLTLIWIVGVINAINLLDGMDGLAAGVSVIALVSLAASYAAQGNLHSLILIVSLVGAVIGFLYYNFNPASIFMGDTGSLFLGFMLATYSLRGSEHANPLLALLIPVLAMGLPLIDTGLAIVRRFLERRPLFHPDKDHIHHRIAVRLGLSHRNTVLMLYLVSVVLGGAAFLIAAADDHQATLILLGTGVAMYLFLRWLGYLRVRETLRMLQQRYRRRPAPASGGDGFDFSAGTTVTVKVGGEMASEEVS